MPTAPAPLDFDTGPGGPRLDVAARSAIGAGPGARTENQDNFLLIDCRGQARFLRGQEEHTALLPHWPPGHARLAVLDGMGGHGHGRQASEAVVESLLSMPPCGSVGELSARLDALHAELQVYFDRTATVDAKRPGTTLTLLEIRPGTAALLYHVGDSRLYEVCGDVITPLTIDHVPATGAALGGLIGEAEWWRQVHGEHRPQIAQAFILGNAFVNPAVLSDPLYPLSPLNLPAFLYHLPDRRALELRPGHSYLLATDGFWSCGDPYAWVGSWPRLFAQAGTAADQLAQLWETMAATPPAQLHPDNLTAILIRALPPAAQGADETVLPQPIRSGN
ncbi:MAG TPA: protein phosphatase [Telluria sp.]|nr:protein phosphatase [Telluria sp.]